MRNGIHRIKTNGRRAATVTILLAACLALFASPYAAAQTPQRYWPGSHTSAYPESAASAPVPTSMEPSSAPSSNPLDLSAYHYSEDSWRTPIPTTRGIYEYPAEGDEHAEGPRRPDMSPMADVEVLPRLSSTDRNLEGVDRIQASSLTLLGYFGKGANEPAAEENYNEGMEFYRQAKYAAAADKFSWAEYWAPDGTSIKEEALYMEAESHFFAHEYSAAKKDYLGLLEWYDYSKHRDVAVNRLFRIAQFWEGLEEDTMFPSITLHLGDRRQPWIDTFGATMSIYETIWLNDPRGRLADDSLIASGAARMQRSRFEDAAADFENLRREHPDSEHVIRAYQLEIGCRTAMYQGAEYDTAPLRQASRLVDQSIVQFGPELGANRERMLELRREIQEEEAKHEWLIAAYYDKKKYYGAAKVYYQSIAEEYAGTSYGQAAAQRFDEIENEPDKPDRFAWARWAIGPQEPVE
jgi:outer membrane protein assembly factor BamD (BamD/ComL family)